MTSKLVLKSTTKSSLHDRFTNIMKTRPREDTYNRGTGSTARIASEKNKRLAEEFERKQAMRPTIERRSARTRIGDIGQGGVRALSRALPPQKKSALAGRIGKANQVQFGAKKALARATNMLRETERELRSINGRANGGGVVRRGGGARRGVGVGGRIGNAPAKRGAGGRGGGGDRGGAGRGGGFKKGGGRGGGRGGKGRVPTANDLDKDLDSYMMKTKGGLDSQLDAYMSQTKKGMDAQLDEYMAAKTKPE